MLGRRARRIGATLIVVSGITVIVALATGEVALVTTHGVSMLPRFHTGDLAVIVPASQYRIGDIVGYNSPLLHITVLHRIVAEHAGLFTFMGDHNSFRDPVALPASAIRGRLWLHVPQAGTVLGWVRSPAGLGLLAFVLIAFGVVGATGRSRRQRSSDRAAVGKGAGAMAVRSQRPAAGTVSESWWPVAVLLVSACLLGLVTDASWSRPTTHTGERALTYNQRIAFSYSATAPPGVIYPSGTVVTTDPVFLRLVTALDVKARYTFEATSPGASTDPKSQLSGTIGATAVLEGPGGWSGQLVSEAPVSFSGAGASIDVPVDLTKIATLENEFTSETGQPLGTTSISVTPTVHIGGFLDGARVSDTIAPPLAFQMSGGVLSLMSATPAGTAGGFPQLSSSRSGSVGRQIPVPARMSILGGSIGVASARRLALLGWVVLIFAAIGVGVWLRRRRRMDEPARIRATYGHELVAVSASPATNAQLVVDVETFGELARLARRYDCVILEYMDGGGHTYYVECGATIYRCGVEREPAIGPIDELHADRCVGRPAPQEPAAASNGRTATLVVAAPDVPRRGGRTTGPPPRDDTHHAADEVDLLTTLAKAEWVSGVGDPGSHLHAAAILAKDEGLVSSLVEPLLVSLRTSFDAEQDSDPEKIELLECSLASPQHPDAVRARLLGALAVELIFVGDSTSRGPMLDEARKLAHGSRDPRAVVETTACHFLARPRSSWSAGHLALDRATCDDALDVATRLGDPLAVATMQDCAASYALLAGDGEGLRAHAHSLTVTSAGGQNQVALRAQLRFEQTIAMLEGRLGDAQGLATEVARVEREARLCDGGMGSAKRQLALWREQGRLAELIPVFSEHLAVSPTRSMPSAVLAFLSADTGDCRTASMRLQNARRAGLGEVPDDADWPLTMAMLSEAAAHVSDLEAAALLHEIIGSHDGLHMWASGISCGPTARLLAMLEATLGWQEHADWHFAAAIESSRRVNSPLWTARCHLDWARTWIERGETLRAVQLIHDADALTGTLALPTLQRQSATLKDRLERC